MLIPTGFFSLIIGKEWGGGGQNASVNFEIKTVSSSEPGRIDKANLNVQAGFRLPIPNWS